MLHKDRFATWLVAGVASVTFAGPNDLELQVDWYRKRTYSCGQVRQRNNLQSLLHRNPACPQLAEQRARILRHNAERQEGRQRQDVVQVAGEQRHRRARQWDQRVQVDHLRVERGRLGPEDNIPQREDQRVSVLSDASGREEVRTSDTNRAEHLCQEDSAVFAAAAESHKNSHRVQRKLCLSAFELPEVC